MTFYLRVLIWLLIFPVFLGVVEGYADRIYLKDGTVQESERVWQSELYVHFILKGTTGVVIRYAKEIVDRISIDGVEERINAKTQAPAPTTPEQGSPDQIVPVVPDKKVSLPKAPAKDKAPDQPNIVDQTIVRTHKGLTFYDPRRNRRYWATNNSKHNSLSDALKALAKTYGQSVPWVEAHMGTENDLGAIHHNLMMHQGDVVDAQAKKSVPPLVVEGLFYNKGKAKPYRIGPNKVFENQSEAVKALARQYGHSVEWVQDNFGQSNDLNTIHSNLTKAKMAPAAPAMPKQKADINENMTPAAPAMPKRTADIKAMLTTKAVPKGKEFYNPRRKKKYWIGEKNRYNSLDDALDALAKQYNVPVEWVERYMGETNDLTLIHQNIQESLK